MVNPQFQSISLQEIQNIEKNILGEFCHYCHKQGLRYYMAYGTLLGAIRHSGFIPWDDDIDVFMPRSDYEVFRNTFNDTMKSEYRFVDRSNLADWPYAYGKIVDTRTEMEETTYKSGKIGVYIDVFPLDGLPTGLIHRDLHMLRVNFIHYILITVQKTNLSGKSIFRSVIKHILYPFAKLWGMNNIICHLEKLCKKYDYNTSKYIASQTLNTYGMREIMPKQWYENSLQYAFEDITVAVPNGYDNILCQIYGDYMKLPPEEKRSSHHQYRVRFLKR